MHKTTFFKVSLLALIFLQSFTLVAQNLKPFAPSRFDKDLKGDMLLIGNSILNRNEGGNKSPNNPYNGDNLNSDFDMQFINIDNGATTGIFNSSSANLVVPNSNAPAASCYKIVYAGLYWGAVTKGTSPITNVKFKMPTGGYNDIVGTVIHDSGNTAIGTSYPYACYADVTNLVTGIGNPNPEGTYTIANVSSKVGSNGGTGLSAGWSLFIVYEDPKLPAKSITSFDGFSAISSTVNLDIPVSGFRTIPNGPVRAKFAFSALEGDQSISGDYLTINGVIITPSERPQTGKKNKKENFFNSSVTSLGSIVTTGRNPNSSNTLGYDAGILEINNNGNAIIKNDDTSATIGLRSSQDVYFYYFNAIALDIIEPKIVLTKQVFDKNNNDIGNKNVTLGEELYYNIGFQNIGNDNAENFTIKDILPINILFDPANIVVPNGSGITYVYTPATRTIIFTIPKELVEKEDPRYVIKFKVRVVPECNDLSDACSDRIQNQAFASYTGVISGIEVDDQLSLSTFGSCYLGTPSPTNFLVGVDDCKFTKSYELCGDNVVLTAANGYDSYSWSTSPTGSPVIGTTQSITVTQTGTYYVHNTAVAPCLSIDQVVTVTTFGTVTNNPIIPFADEVVKCLNNNKDLPKIFLCGANATRLIRSGITDALSIIWEKLDETSCPTIGIDDCANENTSCTWTEVGRGADYTANTSGQFRLVLNYRNGCFTRYYFNVFQNQLNPTATSRDIICDTAGEIVVGGVPVGYEYSLDPLGPFQDSNIFPISTANSYTVYIKQKGVSTFPCLFSVPGIDVLARTFTVSEFVSQPLCNGDKGTIKLAANDVRAGYYYKISQGGIQVNSVGPINDSDFTFSDLNPGIYDYEVKTEDGCLKTGSIEIKEPEVLRATIAQTKALNCEEGEIKVTTSGGTSPFSYYVNGSLSAQYVPEIVVPATGTYNVKIIDYNGCETNVTIDVAEVPKPEYTVSKTDVKCYGTNSGEIKFDVTNANGYTLSYGISTDNGVNYTYGINPTISNLVAGDYYVTLKYTLTETDGTISECIDLGQAITITAPSTALTASAGVASLAGCTLSGDGGLLRITNVQGGIGGYEYSFDGGASWQTSNEKEVLPGTYVLKVRDQGGCEYTIPYDIILDEKPTAPTITVDSSAFNCDGTATSTVTVTNTGSGNYEYEYLIDGNQNPNTADPKVFLNVPSGSHTITVNYKLVSVPTYSNLLFEDFGNGDENVKSPGASPNFCFENQLGTGSCGSTPALHYGEYTVTNTLHPNSWHEWKPFPKDHSGDKNGKGRFFVTDVGTVIKPNDVCYKKTIHDIIPNRPIEVEIWVRNLFAIGTSNSPDPNLILDLEPVGGTLATALSIRETGPVPRTNGWVPYKLTLNPGDNTSLDFAVRIKNPGNQGIDFAFDDIKVYQLPKSCITEVEFPIIVPTDKAFTATVSGTDLTCATPDDGTITIVAENFDATNGFEYSINGGTDWSNSTTSSVKIKNLPAAIYDIQVRYDNSGACTLPLGTIEIKAPTPVTVLANVTQEATCSTGATITASAGGGNPTYEYELRESDGVTIVKAFSNNNGIFTDVSSGDYVVYARDAKLCVSAVGASVSVIAPIPPTATLDATSNLCFDSNATIVVTIAGGVGPFRYQVKVNAGAYSDFEAVTGTSFSYTATATGTYTFKVIDKNNCESNEVTQLISPKLTALPKINKSLSCVTGSSDAIIEVEIIGGTSPYTYVVTNSAGTILVSDGTTTGPKFQYSAATADTYTFEIKDANNCPLTVTQKVNPLVAVTANATVTDVTCFGADNGSVILEALTGVAPFTFQLSGGTLVSSNNTLASYSGLIGSVAGTSYDYIVTDSKGCIYNGTITVKQPEALEVTASITTAYTCDGPATITAVADKGNAPYTYVLKRNASTVASNTTGVFSNLSVAGDYTVTVSDAKSCPLTVVAGTIVALNPPTAMTIGNSALTCPTNKATVTITNVTNAAGIEITSGLEYRIVAPTATAFQSSNSFADLDPGVIYTFEVKDANNCIYSKPYSIAPLPVFTVASVVDADVQCLDEANGSATFTVSGLGNNVDYTYTIDGGTVQSGTSPNAGTTFTIVAPGLNAGTHSITVTNTLTNCLVIASVTIAAPPTVLALAPTALTHVTCNDLGTAVINATGGWGSYTYAVTLAGVTIPATGPTNTFKNLQAGVYSFTVTDLKGCEVLGSFPINDKVAVVASIDVTSNLCYDPINKATIKVTPNTFANYVYSINNATPQDNGTFAGLTPGKYTIRVTDTSTGCYVDLAEQTIASPLAASTTLLKDLDCDSTNPEAKIEVSIKDGYPDYKYRVNTTGNPFSGTYTDVGVGQTKFIYSDLAGTYYFEITDNKGCTTVVSTTINALVKPDFTTTQIDVKCKGDETGTITVKGIPATGTYSYSKDNGVNWQSSNVFAGLKAGYYQIVVKDAKQCLSDPKTVEIKEPLIALSAEAEVTTRLMCGPVNVSQAATITVTPLNGTPLNGGKYKYDYGDGNGFVDSNTRTTNIPGTVNIIVKDANGCTFITSVEVIALNPPTALAFAQANPITCESTKLNTDLKITVTDGVAPFKFEITSTDAAVAPTNPFEIGVTTQEHTFVDLAPGTYFFKVTDANNCTIVDSYKIDAVVAIQAVGAIVTNVTCNGVADGKIKFTVSGNRTGGYTYSLTGSISGIITGLDSKVGDVVSYSGLKGGEDYTFTVTNTATKCVATKTITLSQPAAITALDANATKVFCSKTTSTITVSASGGTSPLYFAVVKLGAAAPVFPGDYNTTGLFTKDTSVDGLAYVAYVMDKNGNCSQNIPVNVVNNAAPTIDPVADTCYPGASFAVTVSGTVYASSSIQYGIGTTATNINYNTNSVKNITAPGTYFIGVKDDNGCEVTTSFIVNDQLILTPKLDKDLTCFLPVAAQITLSAGGGTGTYTYEYRLDPSAIYIEIAGNVYNPTVAGDYYFRVTSGGCSVETIVPVKVTDPVSPVINDVIEVQSIKCNGDETAAINIDIDYTKGVPAFVFNVARTAPTPFDYGIQTTGLAAGDYTITVTDAKGCTATKDIIITQPDPIVFDLSKVDIQCTGGTYTLGSITVKDVDGGTAPYKYFITNNFGDVILGNPYVTTASEDYTFNGIINFGLYTINVVDANGCSFSKQITMTSPPSDLTISIDTSAPDCTDGTATVTVLAPTLGNNYTFGIFNSNQPPFSTNFLAPNNGFDSHIFTGLTPGVKYIFVVHDGDTGCDYINEADIAIPAASTLASTITPHNVTCIGENDGYVAFSITGYDVSATHIEYQVFDSVTNVAVSAILSHIIGDPLPVNYPVLPALPADQVGNLEPGSYYIVFTEKGGAKDGCKIASTVFDIEESSIELSLTASVYKNESCNGLGQIVAVARDGSGSYTYFVNTTGTKPDATTVWNTTNTFNLPSGTYHVFAKDSNGCIQEALATVLLTKDPDPVFTLAVVDLCAGEGNYEVLITVTDFSPSMAPYSVSVNGGAFQNFTGLTYSATGLNSGEQTIIIQNKNGCPVEDKITINAKSQATAEVSKPLDCSVSPNAVITVTITKGTGDFKYAVKKGSGSFASDINVGAALRTFDFPVASADADTYVFQIKDANGCIVETNEVIVDPIVLIVPDYTPIEPLCNGGTGTIELSASGGKGPYTYNFNSLGFSTTTLYDVPAGIYSYIVKDALGCEVTASATLGEPTAVTVGTPVITPLTCGPGNVGQAATVDLSLVASGGSGTYLYSFAGSGFSTQTSYTVEDIDADQLNIPFTVQDENGCEASGTVDILKLNPPTDFDMTPSAVITCSTTAIDVTISNVENALGPVTTGLSYQIISPIAAIIDNANNPVFTGLIPGNYVFQVTDANGCVKQLPYEIFDVVNINIVEQSTTGITCFGATDGKASFFVSGFASTATYHYEVDGVLVSGNFFSPTIDLTGLAAGPHTIEVFDDATDCSKLISFEIEAPTAALVIDKTVTPLGCTTLGAVTITARDGWGNYDYTLTQPDLTVLNNNTGVFGGLTQVGGYTISVKDANGCEKTDTFNLVNPTPPTAAIDVLASNYCYDGINAATLVVKASLGVAPYFFSIDNGVTFNPSNSLPVADDTYTFSNLSPGSYNVVVKDAYGCKSIVPLNTVIESQLFATAENKKDIFCTVGNEDGTIKISAVGGYGSYEYTVSDGVTTSLPIAFPVGSSTADFTVTAPGTYTFVVYDAKGCSYAITSTVVMVAPTAVTFTPVATSPSCMGTQGELGDGSILVTLDPLSVDNPDYKYTIVGTNVVYTKTQVNNGLFTGLIAGTYDVTVTSARGCSDTKNVEITAPAPVVAAATISPFTCSVTNTLNATIVTVTGTGGAGTGAIADYKYSKNGINWNDANTFTVIDTEADQNLTYYVKDANGCIDDVQITINPFPKLISAIATQDTQIDCLNSTETIKVDISGGTNTPLAFTYQAYKDGLADGGLVTVTGTTFNYPATTAGSYYEFEIFDNNTGCSIKSDLYEVPVFDTMQVIASAAADVDCNGNATGAIEINIINYTGAYSYEIFKGGVSTGFTGVGNTTANPFILPHGLVAGIDYTVEVTQTAYPSCTIASGDVIISEPAALDLSGLDVNVKNQYCDSAGAVLTVDVATIVGGTRDYEYAFVARGVDPAGSYSPSPTKTIPTSQITPLFDEIDVYVKDANGCFDFRTVQISADPLPAITDVTVDNQCADANGYRIDVVATGVDPLKYSLDGVQFQDDAFFTVFAAGDYTVTVMDNNGCTTTATTAVTVLEPLTLRGEVSLVPTCKDADGEITLYATGGTVIPANNYVYFDKNIGTPQPSNVFTGYAPGTYNFVVRDLGTLCEKEVQVIIDAPTDVIGITATPTAVTCKGGSDGSILVSLDASNNNPIYTYALSGPVGFTARSAQESPLFENLPAGSYTVTVTSGRGCEAQGTAVVVEPNLIVVAAPTVDGFGCTTGNSLNFATISVDPTAITGGSTNYVNYEFIKVGTPNTRVYFGPNSQYTEYDLLGGTYIVNVYDDKGCMGSTTASVTIDPYIRLESADVTVTAAITCLDGESIQVNATTNAVIPPGLDYAITDAAGNSVAGNPDNQNGVFTALPIGNYIITVSNPDTGCSIQTVHYVNNPNTFVLKAVKTSDVICYNSNEGTVELTLIDNQTNPDDSGEFNYVLTRPDGTTVNGNSPDKGPFTLTGLTAGLYSVTATLVNSPFCSASTSFTIVQPAAALDITETNTEITCVAGNNDGTISVSASGGWAGGYEFEVLKDGNPFIGYTTQTEFTGLTAGIYRINVKDSKGCVDFVEVELKNPDPIIFTATLSAAAVSCFGDASATITVDLPTGGSGSYLYTLISTFADGTVTSNGPQISPIFPNLGAGDYVVKVTDSWNCSAVSATFTISEPTKVVASLVVKTTQTCNDLTVLELSATGGTPPYTYSADGTFTATGSVVTSGSFATSTTFSVPVGTYHYYVRDANGCTSYISNDIKIDPLEPLEANLDVQNAVVNCKGDASGVIVAHATGGLGNYVYTLLDGAGNAIVPAPVQSSPGRFDGLIAGFYQVKVESGDCEMISGIVEIKEPLTGLTSNPVVTDVTCNGENNGKIEINASGGTGQIQYAISPRLDQFFDSGVFDELVPGVYQVVIQDENGCFIVQDFEIKEPSLLSVSTVADSVFPEICAGDKDGAFSIEITGGTAPYSVSLGDINGTYTTGTASQTEFDFTGLSGGNHFVFIRDANGCTTDWLVALPESINMNPIAMVQYDCVNNTAANSVTITIDGSITDPTFVDYALDGSGNFGPSSVFTNLAPGTHYVTARHSNGCEQQTINFEIKQVEPLTLVLNDGGLNEIVAVAAGGGGNYKYTLNGESYGNKSNFIIYKSGNYTVTVTDGNGCVASATRYFEYIDVCIPNNFTPNGDGINDVWAPGCTVNYKDLTFEVFDRYGRKVGNYRLGQYWDGRYNGTELPSGDYWYVLKLNDVKDAREFVGHFTLYR